MKRRASKGVADDKGKDKDGDKQKNGEEDGAKEEENEEGQEEEGGKEEKKKLERGMCFYKKNMGEYREEGDVRKGLGKFVHLYIRVLLESGVLNLTLKRLTTYQTLPYAIMR